MQPICSFRVLLLAIGGLTATGCSRSSPDAVSPQGTMVQRQLTSVHWLYAKYLEKRQKTPADLADLRAFGEMLPSVEGGPISLTEDFLVSPRDKKPLVIRFGVTSREPPRKVAEDAPPILPDGPLLAHEQDGERGKRFVVYAGSGRVEEVDETRFQELSGQRS
jgi:hypothetical protein